MDIPSPSEYQEDKDLPQCKIKRNYSCSHCLYYTQNPRFYLTHLRDVHGERITISNCSLCLYASRHYQKLVRHMKMVHGSTAEGIPGQSRKRPLIEYVPPEYTVIPPLPTPFKWIIDIDSLSYDLKSSRKTLKDIAAIYFAQHEIEDILAKMEASDVVEVMPVHDVLSSIGTPANTVFGDPKLVDQEELEITCSCGHVSKCFLDYVLHCKSCSQSNEKNYESAPLDLRIRSSNESDSKTNSTNKMKIEKVVDEKDDLKIADENLIEGKKRGYNHDFEYSKIIKDKPDEEKERIEKSKPHDDKLVITSIVPKQESRPLPSHKKVFKCSLCPFWASTASRFHVHIVGHQNKKPFKCSLCSYCSNWRWDITKHIRLRAFRSPSHKNARILMQGENVRRNYTKYDKFITLMKISELDGDLKSKKCGEMNSHRQDSKVVSSKLNKIKFKENGIDNKETKLQEQQKVNYNSEEVQISTVLANSRAIVHNDNHSRTGSKQCKPRTYLILEDGDIPSYKCSKCHFRHFNRDAVLVHVKIHHEELLQNSPILSKSIQTTSENNDDTKIRKLEDLKSSPQTPQPLEYNTELIVDVENDHIPTVSTFKKDSSSVKMTTKFNDNMTDLNLNDRASSSYNDNYAPFRCWHCHQTSNWKHVIQRHCRLKHSGSIRIEALDRSTNSNNPIYRILNLSPNSEVLPRIPPENKTDKLCSGDKNSKHKNIFIDSDPVLSTEMHDITVKDSKKYPLNVKRAELKLLKFQCKDCPYVCSNKLKLSKHYTQKHKHLSIVRRISQKSSNMEKAVNSPSVPSETNEISHENSMTLEKCDYCSFESSCHSAMKCHEQAHIHKSNIKEVTSSEQTKVVTQTMDHLTSEVKIELAADVTEGIQNIENSSFTEHKLLKKDSEVNRQMDTIEKEVQLKIKHCENISSLNSSSYKKSSSLPAQSSRKTIFVNPKTGQIVRRK